MCFQSPLFIQYINILNPLIVRFMALFWVTTRLGVHAFIPDSPVCQKNSFSSRLFKTWSPLIGQRTDTWPGTAINNRVAVLNHAYVPNRLLRNNHANLWHGDVLWCHKVTELKVGLLMRRFRSSVFCGREELLLVGTLTFQLSSFTCTRTCKTHWNKSPQYECFNRFLIGVIKKNI